MSSRNNRYSIRLASEADSPQLLNIYESEEAHGKISLTYTRRPDPYKSLMSEGDKAVVPVIVDLNDNRICGMGACIVHTVTFNGTTVRAGYLTGLKSLPEYRHRIPGGTSAYRFLHEKTRDSVDFYYTTILADNLPVQRMLEKKRKNMPEYHFLGDYSVYVMGTGERQSPRNDVKYQRHKFSVSSLAEVQQLFEATKFQHNLAPSPLHHSGIKEAECFSLTDANGKILAACALWNRQDSKQYTVKKYGGIYRYLKRLPSGFFGYPDLPKENELLNQAYITLLTVPRDPALAAYFLKRVASSAAAYRLLTIGLFENHPLNMAMSLLKTFKYRSRLYTVAWTEDAPELDGRPIYLDVALL